ncbi:ATP-binding protein [Nonomuraea soli]|uniref:Tetratricopeptide (TPR) repeat protein/transcriptional regulator with XRE-family HTH domain n=1 Tax=Nonomuraea soli TaxID=1032476 RepID=A0A7W0CKY3_9ACTN|nr:XRE family transcriptional regulator [Nonomuraea soli]MBA2893089.1 tetratricopeptide (TPR) repeat protein/transcriptional regulator with XRE-family HTH domain [Nonomuraea soli]
MLRRHRRAARLTLEQLAEASGVSARTLSDMERGRSKGPQHRTVTALADALRLAGAEREQLIELAREGRLRDHWARPTGLCELPRPVDDFTGRSAELAWAAEVMRAGEAGPGLITGSAGLGKSTLAIRAAHTLRPDFPDGVFFLDLFGMSAEPLPSDEALGMLLRALGLTDQQLPGGVGERASLYRSLLRERRVLVVLDNAASEEQVRPLLPGGGTARALVTGRRLLAGLEGVRRLSLGPLPPMEATQLLTGILKDRGTPDADPALWDLAQLCGGLPLALRIAGNRLASRPGWNAADFAARLTDEERRLDQLSAGDLKIATAFGLSYDQLAEDTRRVFRRLSLVPGRDFDAALSSVAGGTSIAGAWDALDELVDLGLLQDGASGRYRFHDLVLLFARERLRAEEPAADRDAVVDAVTSWLLRMATSAGSWFEPIHSHRDPELTGLSTQEEADRWLRANVDNWLGALRQAADRGGHAAVLLLGMSMIRFADRWMHAGHWPDVFTLGAKAAAALGDLPRQAAHLNALAADQLVSGGDMEAALRYTAQAMDLAVRGGSSEEIASAHHFAAGALRRLGRLDEAIEAQSRAAEIFKADGDVEAYSHCLGSLGTCYRDAGQYPQALEHYLALWDLVNDDASGLLPNAAAFTRSIALARIGECLGLLGRRSEAIARLTEAIVLLEEAQVLAVMAGALQTLASLLAEEGRAGESRQTYARAAEVFEAIGDSDASDRCRDLAS